MRQAIKRIAFISDSLCYLISKLTAFISILCLVSIFIILVFAVSFFTAIILNGADKTILAGIIVGVFSLVTFFLSKLCELKFQQVTTLRKHKTPTYKRLTKLFFDLLKSIKSDKTKEDKQIELDGLVGQIYACNQDLIVWGSDDVIRKFISYRENIRNPNTIFTSIGDLFLSIRKDLGHKNTGLNNKNILKIFVNSEEIDKSK